MTKDKTPKAIPIELISRLEEIDYSKADISGGNKVIQYRNNLMKLITIDEASALPEAGVYDTIVFLDHGRVMGIIADTILDITKQKMDIKSPSSKEGILGSMIMKGVTTDVVDIGYFISRTFPDWFLHSTANKTWDNDPGAPRKHVLLVDDSSFFRKFMRPVILTAGYRITTAEDGEAGLDILKKYNTEFDLVISDLDMPRMSGIEFIKAAKSNPKLAKIPFIALSSYEEQDFEQDIKKIGFEGLVTKASRNKVLRAINEVLRERNFQDSAKQ